MPAFNVHGTTYPHILCPAKCSPLPQTFAMCTIAETPRQPEHCVAYAMAKLWDEAFPETKVRRFVHECQSHAGQRFVCDESSLAAHSSREENSTKENGAVSRGRARVVLVEWYGVRWRRRRDACIASPPPPHTHTHTHTHTSFTLPLPTSTRTAHAARQRRPDAHALAVRARVGARRALRHLRCDVLADDGRRQEYHPRDRVDQRAHRGRVRARGVQGERSCAGWPRAAGG